MFVYAVLCLAVLGRALPVFGSHCCTTPRNCIIPCVCISTGQSTGCCLFPESASKQNRLNEMRLFMKALIMSFVNAAPFHPTLAHLTLPHHKAESNLGRLLISYTPWKIWRSAIAYSIGFVLRPCATLGTTVDTRGTRWFLVWFTSSLI